MRVLVTRPEPDAAALAKSLSARGHTAIVASLLEIQLSADPLPEHLRGATLLFTSANGVRAACARGIGTNSPVYVVGPATAEAAREAGYPLAGIAEGDAAALARLVAERIPKMSRLVHLAGADTAGDLTGDLARRGYNATRITLYRAVAPATLPGTAAEFLQGAAGAALLFSPRTAIVLTDLVTAAGLKDLATKHRALALSAAVATQARRLPWRIVETADAPATEAILALL